MDFEAISDPLAEVDAFRSAAETAGLALPEAMILATVDELGRPKARVVLLKGRESRELHFFTNYRSAKARELVLHPYGAVCVHYASLALQARIEGSVTQLSDEQSDAYFATRPRVSQLGAWASHQSQPLKSRETLDEAYRVQEARFEGVPVARPAHWGGFRLTATLVELWVGQEGRLHDRAQYDFEDSTQTWRCQRLFP